MLDHRLKTISMSSLLGGESIPNLLLPFFLTTLPPMKKLMERRSDLLRFPNLNPHEAITIGAGTRTSSMTVQNIDGLELK